MDNTKIEINYDKELNAFSIKKKGDKIPFMFMVEDEVYILEFAMCTYGHEDYKRFLSREAMIEYVLENEYSSSFSGHICEECYRENCV